VKGKCANHLATEAPNVLGQIPNQSTTYYFEDLSYFEDLRIRPNALETDYFQAGASRERYEETDGDFHMFSQQCSPQSQSHTGKNERPVPGQDIDRLEQVKVALCTLRTSCQQ
jgi:hypothetical protein